VGSGGHRSLPLLVAEGPWLFQPEHGCLAWLFISLRLVRQADLGEPIPAAHTGLRRRGDGASEARFQPRPRVVCGRYLRVSSRLGRRVATAVRADGGSIPFTIQTRADLVSERMARALRDAGCKEAWIGAESGSQRVLDAMNKGTKVAEIVTARARLKSACIRVGFFIQLGYLDEQLADILATRELLDTAMPDDVGVSVSYPLPGTKFYELVKTQLGDKTHWQESDDLEMMFQGTYTSDFYRAIRDLLHDRVSLEKLNTRADTGEYHRGTRRLEQRWQNLVSSERQYRSADGQAVVVLTRRPER